MGANFGATATSIAPRRAPNLTAGNKQTNKLTNGGREERTSKQSRRWLCALIVLRARVLPTICLLAQTIARKLEASSTGEMQRERERETQAGQNQSVQQAPSPHLAGSSAGLPPGHKIPALSVSSRSRPPTIALCSPPPVSVSQIAPLEANSVHMVGGSITAANPIISISLSR